MRMTENVMDKVVIVKMWTVVFHRTVMMPLRPIVET